MSVAKYCRKHIISGVKAASLDWNTRKLRDTLIPALRRQWTYCSEYGKVLARAAEIKEGKRPGSDLVIFDAEYIGLSGDLLEVAMIEALSGSVLLDTRTAHKEPKKSVPSNPIQKAIAFAKLQKYGSAAHGSNTALLADEIADELKRVGITKQMIMLVWATTYRDLTVLCRFLESAGHYGILPPRRNCIRLITMFRGSIPRERGIGKLEILFPLLYPGHDLVCLNQVALIDCQQTRLVLMALEDLSRPLDQRQQNWPLIAETSVDKWLRQATVTAISPSEEPANFSELSDQSEQQWMGTQSVLDDWVRYTPATPKHSLSEPADQRRSKRQKTNESTLEG